MQNIDTSVFEDVQKDVFALLSHYKKDVLRLKTSKKDEHDNFIYESASLYVVDAMAISKLKEYSTLLSMEYSVYDTLASAEPKKRAKKSIKELLSLDNIVKVINFDKPANAYQTFVSESWKQINDPEKVKQQIDAEFEKHKNKLIKRTKDRLAIKKVSKENENIILSRIEDELKEAQKERDYVIKNFDDLEVCISTYFERTEYAGVRWYVNKQKQNSVNLRKSTPNVIWIESLKEEDKIRPNNKLVHYFEGAKRAYGNLFYKKREEN